MRVMKPVVLITEKEFSKAFAVIVGVDPYNDGLCTALPKGGVIARYGVGHDGIDRAKATENGLLATNTPGVLDDSVAEHAVLMMGGFARHIGACHSTMENNQWSPAIGSELSGKTLLVIGCGPIGRKTAKISAFGFGMRVIGFDILPLDAAAMKRDYGVEALLSDLDTSLPEADFVSLHIPLIPATRHLVDAAFLDKLKSTCVLINTARAPVVDETALFDALKDRRIAGAALDVFENEPLVPVDPEKDLRRLDSVLLTPHIGSSTIEACRRMGESCLNNIQAAFERRYKDMSLLNPDVLKSLT